MVLSPDSIRWAVSHLSNIGDSDLFPWAAEIKVLKTLEDEIISLLSKKPLSELSLGPARRFMVPKDDVSFRRATQLNIFDSVILTAIIYQYGSGIEARRLPACQNIIFSYRFRPQPEGWLYDKGYEWTPFWNECIKRCHDFSHALLLDISDFYNQIYHHTVENQLIESGFPNQATKWIINLLKSLTAQVSRGIPVGPHAAHLLAESSLIPFDNALSSRDIPFIRFVDDIIIFARNEIESRKFLYLSADILDKQQRLIFNKSKTRIVTTEVLYSYASNMIEDRPINAFEFDLLSIIKKYSGGNPYATIMLSSIDSRDLAKFSVYSIEKILSDYLAVDPIDFIRLRWFLRRMTQVGHPGGVNFCLHNLARLVPALAEVCHYFLSVSLSGTHNIMDFAKNILSVLDQEIIKTNEYFSLCILSLFARNGALDHFPYLCELFNSSSSNIQREIILAAMHGPHADWLRELKEDLPSMDAWKRSAFLLAARILPFEERIFLSKHFKASYPLEEVLLKWIRMK